MKNRTLRPIHAIATIVLFLTACSPQLNSTPTSIDVENAVHQLPTATRVPIETAVPITTQPNMIFTDIPVPTITSVSAMIGTSLPKKNETIDLTNFTHLQKVGQWGRGSIQGVAFTPDGQSFIAISELGWSIYRMDALDQPPQWVAFDGPMLFEEFYFSQNGALVEFLHHEYQNDQTYIKQFPSGMAQKSGTGVVWLKPNGIHKSAEVRVQSPDESKVFSGGLSYEFNEELFSEEKTVRNMEDANGNLLYSLRDETPYVSYSDRNGPEGCDLSVFSPCGNALMAVATAPAKVLFSSDSSTFAVLYDPPSLYYGIMKAFSYIRVYESASGDLIGSIGGFTKPVQDFSYSPDGRLLVVGFVDGSLILWNIKSAKAIYGSRHMNAPAWKVVYSQDSKYLLIQRAEEVEVRLTSTGALLYRFDAAEFAVSPVKNLLALGDQHGEIQVRNLDTGESVRGIKAHDDRIYSLAFSQDGLYLASSGKDCDIKLWDLGSGKLLHYFEETAVDAYELGESSRIFSTYLEFIPDRNMLIGFGSWGTVVNWNVNSGATNYVIQSNALEYYNGMITIKPHFPEFFDLDGSNNRFYINENAFDLETGESLGTYQAPANLPKGCSPIGPISIDENLMFTRGYEEREGRICILNHDSLDLLGEIFVSPASDSYVEWVDWLYLSPDGRQLIVTVGSGIIYVYQIV